MVDAGPVNIKLTADGISEIINAFKNLEAAATRLDRLSRSSQIIAKNEAKARLEVAKAATFEAKAKADAAKTSGKIEAAERLNIIKVNERAQREMTRTTEREARARTQAVTKEAREQERLSKQLSSRIVSDVRGTIGAVSRLVSMGLTLLGGMSISNAFGQAMSFDQAAMNASIRSDVPGNPGARISASQIKAQSKQLSLQYGMSETDVAQGFGNYITKSSSGTRAQHMMPFLTQMSMAEGVDLGTLTESSGILTKQNPKLTEKEEKEFMRVIVGQSRSAQGSVEMSELAHRLPYITSSANMFAGNQGDNMVKLMSMFQATNIQTGNVDEAATAVNAFGTSVTKPKNRKRIESLLGHTIDIGGKIEDPQMLMAELMGATKGDVFKLQAATGMREQGAKALRATLQPALDKGGGTKEGIMKAVMDFYTALDVARVKQEDIEKHEADRRASDAFKVAEAMNKLNVAVADVAPQLAKLVTQFGELAPQLNSFLKGLTDLITWAETHPWEAAFATLGALVTKAIVGQMARIASEEIGAAIIAKILGKAAPATPLLTAAAGAGGLALGAAGVAAGLSLGARALEKNQAEDERNNSDIQGLQSDIANRRSSIALLTNEQNSLTSDPVERRAAAARIELNNEEISNDKKKIAELQMQAANKLNEASIKINDAAIAAGTMFGPPRPSAGPRSTSGANFSQAP